MSGCFLELWTDFLTELGDSGIIPFLGVTLSRSSHSGPYCGHVTCPDSTMMLCEISRRKDKSPRDLEILISRDLCHQVLFTDNVLTCLLLRSQLPGLDADSKQRKRKL